MLLYVVFGLMSEQVLAAETLIYDNSNDSGHYYPPGLNTEIADYGTSSGGNVVKFTIGYSTTQTDPGIITIRFYSGVDGSTNPDFATFLKSFQLSDLPGSGTYYRDYSIHTQDQFTLASGNFGYSYEFDNSATGSIIASGGTGNEDKFWEWGYDDIGGWDWYLYWFGGSPYAGFYMKVYVVQPVISGYVKDGSGTGVDGVSALADNGGGSDITDVNGFYEITVPYDWSGTVTASKTGWDMTPSSRVYNDVTDNLSNENYIAYQLTISEDPYELAWARQLGTSGHDTSYGVVVDAASNVFISGYTEGSLGGSNAGGSDAFVSKYDTFGSLLWTRQLGTSGWDVSYGVAVDTTGNIFISGRTSGSLGGSGAGGNDAFVSKYSTTGSLLWTRQQGTSGHDVSYGVAVDTAGNVFISGKTEGSLEGSNAGDEDIFVSKFDTTGSLLWTRQLGTSSEDRSYAVATDVAGNVFVSGETQGSLNGPNKGGYDIFVSKYDPSGNLLWTRQLGSPWREESYAVATDTAGNVFISGYTEGSIGGSNAGSWDAFVSKYNTTGSLLWTRQLGTSTLDVSDGVAVDTAGNIFISGETLGSFDGPNAGEADAFVSKYDPSGNLLWTRQIGTSNIDGSCDVATDEYGKIFISGITSGSLDGPNAGERDAFVVKYKVSPQILEAAPTLDALADFSNGDSNLVDDGTSIMVQNFAFAEIDRRGVLEFDISAIPDEATITSATLELDIILKSGSGDNQPILYLHGYEGNGTLEIADGQVPLNLIGQSDPILALDVITISLNTDYIGSLLSVTNYLGLLALGDENAKQAGFVTIEGQITGAWFAPKLTIEYQLCELTADVSPDEGNGIVNFSDWAVFANAWQSTSNPPSANWNPKCDIAPEGGDGIVDMDDLKVFVSQWLQCSCD